MCTLFEVNSQVLLSMTVCALLLMNTMCASPAVNSHVAVRTVCALLLMNSQTIKVMTVCELLAMNDQVVIVMKGRELFLVNSHLIEVGGLCINRSE